MSGPYRATVTGPFPRPEPLIQATRDLERGRIAPEQVEAAFVAAEAEVRRVEASLGLDAVTGGYLRWPDLFRPFVDLWSGLNAGPLTRFFETNTFYRRPVFESPPVPGQGRLADWLPQGNGSRAILPGPYTFAALGEFRYSPAAGTSPLLDVATALATELRALGPSRPRFLQFQEPMLAYAPPTGEVAGLAEAYRRLTEAAGGSSTSIWTYFGDGGPVLSIATKLPVDVVGFDLFQATIRPGTSLGGRGIGLGCVDPTTTIGEDPTELLRLVRAAEEVLRPSEVWLGPNPPLDLLPYDSAVTKLKLLPKLREALGR